jgi:hypothetical protein
MAVTVESFATSSTAGDNDVTITFPGTYTPLEDDIVFLWTAKNAVGLTYTNASPWVEVQTGGFEPSDSSMRVSVIYRVVTAGEESGGTLTYTASNVWSANSAGATIGVALRGVDTAAVIDSFGTTSQATTGTSHSLAGLTGANLSTGSLVLSGIFADGAGASDYAEPTDWGTVQLNASQMRSAVFSKDATTTSGVDISAVSITGPGDEFVSVTVAFTAAAGGGTTDVDPLPTVVSPRTAVANIGATANIAPSATVVSPRTAVANVGATANVNPSPTVVTARPAVGNVGATANNNPVPTIVSPRTAVANVGTETPVEVNPAPTVVSPRAAVASIAGHATVAPTATVVSPRTAVANIGGHAGVTPSSTVVLARTAVASLGATANIAPVGTVVSSVSTVAVLFSGTVLVEPVGAVVLSYCRTGEVGSWNHLRSGRYRYDGSWRNQRLRRLLRVPGR